MAGLSLTLFWVDDELEALWWAPADTPAYRKFARTSFERRRVVRPEGDAGYTKVEATAASRRLATMVTEMLVGAAEALRVHEAELGHLDAVAGDGDHGVAMVRGAEGAVEAAKLALEQHCGVRDLLMAAAEKWSDQAGGASGALWGAALLALASSPGDREYYQPADVVKAAAAARDAMVALGRAEEGDKTILDSVFPYVAVLEEEIRQSKSVTEAVRHAAEAATRAAAATAPLRPRKGRARPLADRSVGTADPGAVSFALIVTAIADQVAGPMFRDE
jgi:D-erythrulose 4-kinase